MTVIQEVSSSGGCAALNEECKCWKLSCEHIALSVMWRFWATARSFLFLLSSSAGSSLLQAHDCARLVFEDLADRQHATINCMWVWQAAQWVCRLKSSQATVKGKPPAPLSPPPPPPLHGFVEGPSQLLCLPKRLDTVAQLAPTGPWHQPGARPKQWQKTTKKATNNRQLSLVTSTQLKQLVSGRSLAWEIWSILAI